MFLNQIEYFAPQTVEEVLDLLNQRGEKARVLAGGTDLINMIKERLIDTACLVDINSVAGLRGIFYERGEGAVIGSATNISELEHSPEIRDHYYALFQASGELGSVQVRNMATLGGNSCHASPAAETPTPLVALGARVVLAGQKGERELPLEDFITGNRQTALAAGEIMVKFILPEPAPRSASRYGYIGLRDAMEIDAVNMAVNLELEPDGETIKILRLVMGSVSPRPLISTEVPPLLEGKMLSDELLQKAAAAAAEEAKPISDIRASAEYRREMVGVLAERLIQEAYKAAQEV